MYYLMILTYTIDSDLKTLEVYNLVCMWSDF